MPHPGSAPWNRRLAPPTDLIIFRSLVASLRAVLLFPHN